MIHIILIKKINNNNYANFNKHILRIYKFLININLTNLVVRQKKMILKQLKFLDKILGKIKKNKIN